MHGSYRQFVPETKQPLPLEVRRHIHQLVREGHPIHSVYRSAHDRITVVSGNHPRATVVLDEAVAA